LNAFNIANYGWSLFSEDATIENSKIIYTSHHQTDVSSHFRDMVEFGNYFGSRVRVTSAHWRLLKEPGISRNPVLFSAAKKQPP
jgi:hypothetical protein